MKHITKYTHYIGFSVENKIKSDLAKLQLEIDDYLRELVDGSLDDVFSITTSIEEYPYFHLYIKSKSHNHFYWKEIEDVVYRFMEMSEFKLEKVKYWNLDHQPRNKRTISIPDNKQIHSIKFFLIKK